MPNIGVLLKQEIARLSRREIRAQLTPTKKASAQHRRRIAVLKRQVATLERRVGLLQRRVLDKPTATPASSTTRKVRFVATGLKSQRNRLGLSAADYGKLAGVSAQSVYNWEQGHARPRPEQLKMIATLREMGKREAQGLLEQRGTKAASGRRRR